MLATVPTDVLMAVGVWILYAAIGIGMVVAVVMGIRAVAQLDSGGTRAAMLSGAKPIRCHRMMIWEV